MSSGAQSAMSSTQYRSTHAETPCSQLRPRSRNEQVAALSRTKTEFSWRPTTSEAHCVELVWCVRISHYRRQNVRRHSLPSVIVAPLCQECRIVYCVTVVNSTGYKRNSEETSSVGSEWPLDASQLTKLVKARTSNALDEWFHRQLTVHDDTKVTDIVDRHNSLTNNVQWGFADLCQSASVPSQMNNH